MTGIKGLESTGMPHTGTQAYDFIAIHTEFDLKCSPHLGCQPHAFAMAHGVARSTSQGPPLLPQILASLGKSPIVDPKLEMFPQTIPSLSPQWIPGIKSWKIKTQEK